MNELRLYRNVNSYYDAWEIDRMYEQEEEELDRTNWQISKAEYDDRPAWLLQGRIRESSFSQYIVLSRDGRQLEFYTKAYHKGRLQSGELCDRVCDMVRL
mgnify:FL=1